MHCGARPCLSLSLILPGRRRTLNLQTVACGRCPQVRRATRVWAESTTAAIVGSCMPVRCHARSRSVARLLVSAVSLGFRPSSSRNMVTASHNSRLSCSCFCPQTPTKPLGPQPRIASLRPTQLSCLIGPQALCFSAQLIIILLISGISSCNTCAIIADAFGLSTGNNTFSFFLSLCLVIALASALFASSELSQPLYGLDPALYGPQEPSERFRASSRPSRSSSLALLPGLICYEAVSAIASSCSRSSEHARPIVALCHQCVPLSNTIIAQPFSSALLGPGFRSFASSVSLKLVQLFFFVFALISCLRRSLHGHITCLHVP